MDRPSQHLQEATQEAQRLRGWIANGYAQIEYFLGDIIVRSLDMAEYAGVGQRLPHGSPDRVKRVRRLLDHEGPFSEFEAELRTLLEAFEKHHENRNLLAHGFCTVFHTPDHDIGFEFRKWHRGDTQDTELVKMFRLIELAYIEAQITELSSRSLDLFQQVHQRLGLTENDR